ncbi:hypothetical protein GY45DRAFT_459120 [Cubamyces sp. BRFM 1775]|nr:hypothetical protein GY45DRAFT_459120 [Cubamyces sp. BRFM 1775]
MGRPSLNSTRPRFSAASLLSYQGHHSLQPLLCSVCSLLHSPSPDGLMAFLSHHRYPVRASWAPGNALGALRTLACDGNTSTRRSSSSQGWERRDRSSRAIPGVPDNSSRAPGGPARKARHARERVAVVFRAPASPVPSKLVNIACEQRAARRGTRSGDRDTGSLACGGPMGLRVCGCYGRFVVAASEVVWQLGFRVRRPETLGGAELQRTVVAVAAGACWYCRRR